VVWAQAERPAAPPLYPVVIEAWPCQAEALVELQRIVGAELGVAVAARPKNEQQAQNTPEGVDPLHSGEDSNTTLVEVSCVDEWIRLEVFDPVSGKTLVRHVSLGQSNPAIRTRMLGLSIAELVAASWIELSAPAAKRMHIVEAKASERLRETALSAAQRTLALPSSYEFEALGAMRRFGSSQLTTAGAGARASWIQRGWLGVGGDLLLEGGSADVPLGSIRAILASTGLSLRLRRNLGWLAVEGGFGLRVGLVGMQGVAGEVTPVPEARAATLLWAGPMAMLRMQAFLPRKFIFVVGVEAGRVTRAADGRVDGRTVLSIDKDWVGITVGPGLSFDE